MVKVSGRLDGCFDQFDSYIGGNFLDDARILA